MPSSLSLLAVLSAIALAIAGASLLAIVLIVVGAMAFEVYVTGSGPNGLG